MRRHLNGLLRAIMPRIGASSPLPLGSRLRWASRRWTHFFSWPGVLAIGVLTICSALYFSVIRPTHERMDMAHHRVISLQEQIALASKALAGKAHTPAEQLAEFYQKFPPERGSSLLLEKLMALAESRGIRLNEGEYKATSDKAGRIVRFQMTLPVKGEYPQIRKFLSALPSELPVVALQSVQFERQKVADPAVEAKLKLVLYLEHKL
jgi:Tfp pilus assembly protein PilO